MPQETQANSVFARCDLNKNGQIERDELQFLCEAMHQRTVAVALSLENWYPNFPAIFLKRCLVISNLFYLFFM